MRLSSNSSEGLPRKLTAVGTVGELNQLFTVYEKNWNCADCGQENYASRPRCLRCKKQKPEGVNNYVLDPAVQAMQAGHEITWQEVVDPSTYQIYYYNKVTGATQWDRPAELGPAPLATGWFGRGQSGSMAAQLYSDMNQFYLSRPAIKQKEYIDPKKYHLEGAQEYNIWYGKFIGDYNDKMDREPAPARCKLETDAGYTKADLGQGDKKIKRFFCLHFARGICAKGNECSYFHRIPLPEDDAKTDELFDCFGRQRHNKHKDDMSGVGTFAKPCRTLFVGNLQKSKYDSPKDLEDTLWRHFGEWGELESLNVVHRLSIAFPRYRLRTSAEFAKEAMSCQALDQQEVLSIRWAHDDPNPVAKDSIARADKDAMVSLLKAKGISLTPAGFEYPVEYQMPETKRLRLDEGGGYLEQYPELAYPNTDNQFSTTNDSTEDNLATANAQKNALERLGLLDEEDKEVDPNEIPSVIPEDSEVGKETNEEKDNSEEDEGDEGGWSEFLDETTGAKYYFNTATGESSWVKPEDYEV